VPTTITTIAIVNVIASVTTTAVSKATKDEDWSGAMYRSTHFPSLSDSEFSSQRTKRMKKIGSGNHMDKKEMKKK